MKKNKRRPYNIPRPCPRKQRIIGDDKDRVFEVVRIHAKKTIRGVVYYLLEFKGFDRDQCSYEPESMIECPDLVADFENRYKKNVMKKEKKKTPRPKVLPIKEYCLRPRNKSNSE